MIDSRIERLQQICVAQLPRAQRAREAAETIADAGFRWVAIYEVDDGKIRVLGESGAASRVSSTAIAAGALATAAFATIDGIAVVPMLGAESAVVIGALAVERASASEYDEEERAALERYASMLIALFE